MKVIDWKVWGMVYQGGGDRLEGMGCGISGWWRLRMGAIQSQGRDKVMIGQTYWNLLCTHGRSESAVSHTIKLKNVCLEFCFVLSPWPFRKHCHLLWASVTNSLRFVFEVLFCVSPWPLRDSFWCTADFQVHM